MRIVTYLKLAGVPQDRHRDAYWSLKKAMLKYWLVIPVKIVAAAFMGRIAGLTSKPGAEQPVKALAWFGNNISINGDRGPWSWKTREDGVRYSSRDPVPPRTLYRDDGDGQLTLYNYYYKPGVAYAEDPKARANWLTRNPASRFAQIMGKKLRPVDKIREGATEWSHVLEQWFYRGPDGSEIWVLYIDGIWSIKVRRKTALGFWIDGGYGYKLNNIGSDYHCLDPNMEISVSHLTHPAKSPKAGTTIIGVIK